jgi:hypothetical protein
MAFRQFGGKNYAKKNNIVRNFYTTSDNLLLNNVSSYMPSPNTLMDSSNNILLHNPSGRVSVLNADNLIADILSTDAFISSLSSTGTNGGDGPTGPTGPQGIQGPTGSQGIQGPTGDQGTQGSTGSQGIQGPTGDQGTQGPTGTQGTQGIQGIQGPTGSDYWQYQSTGTLSYPNNISVNSISLNNTSNKPLTFYTSTDSNGNTILITDKLIQIPAIPIPGFDATDVILNNKLLTLSNYDVCNFLVQSKTTNEIYSIDSLYLSGYFNALLAYGLNNDSGLRNIFKHALSKS